MISISDDNVRVALEALGEGADGEALPGEPAFLRFYVERLDAAGWQPVENASYCTQVRDTVPLQQAAALAARILEAVREPVMRGESVKRVCERLSWLTV